MGCDIHVYVEVKKDEIWHWHKPLISNSNYDNDRPIDDYNTPEKEEDGYDGRNYNLFGILANVRNGRGFAGLRTGDGFNPIATPKGIPSDVDPEILAEIDDWGSDGHSHSYLTLAEILDYDWEQVTESQGYISAEEYEKWDKKSEPDHYCGGISGRNILTVTGAAYLQNHGTFEPKLEVYILVKWVMTYRKAAGASWWEVVDRLKTYAKQFSDVRLTFFFDN